MVATGVGAVSTGDHEPAVTLSDLFKVDVINRLILFTLLLFSIGRLDVFSQQSPIIDVHLHSYTDLPPGTSASWADREDARRLVSSSSADEHFRRTLEIMDRYNVVLAVVSGPDASIRAWRKEAPGRFIGGAFLGDDGLPEHSVDSLDALVSDGTIGVFGELGLQYFGIAPDDPRLAPYFDYVEETGIPVALHTGLGPPGGPHTFAPQFRVTLGRPTLFEPVIASRSELTAYLMHAGWPYVEETKAMMYIYPKLYVDVGVLAWALPEAEFHSVLRELIESGFGDRIMFGTDQMMWPEAVELAIETIQEAEFLTTEQKRAIFYDNAARFLKLDEATISRHHGEQ